jgi:hypothetical protein
MSKTSISSLKEYDIIWNISFKLCLLHFLEHHSKHEGNKQKKILGVQIIQFLIARFSLFICSQETDKWYRISIIFFVKYFRLYLKT